MSSGTRPWSATMTARLTRAVDADTMEIIDYSPRRFTRRVTGPHSPLQGRLIPLDDDARRALIDELEGELIDPPADVSAEDLRSFVELLRYSLETTT